MKPNCDEETTCPLTYPFVTYLWFTLLELTNQKMGSTNQCSPLLSDNTHLWLYYYL